MSTAVEVSADGSRLIVHLPLAMRKRGGRKIVMAPEGTHVHFPRHRPDSALIKAIARAYRWQRLLEEGAYSSLREIAAAERISPSYISRLLKLTLLKPAIIEAALDGALAPEITSQLVQKEPSLLWQEQLPPL